MILYIRLCREHVPGFTRIHQIADSDIHYVVDDITDIIVAAAVTISNGSPMLIDLNVKYIASFVLGLLIFQLLFMKHTVMPYIRRPSSIPYSLNGFR